MGMAANNEYGIKAYTHWHTFATKAEYEAYLMDWIAGTDGSEQDRAVNALVALTAGQKKYDSDSMP